MTGEGPAEVGNTSLDSPAKERDRSSLPSSVEHIMLKQNAGTSAARADSTSPDECVILLAEDPFADPAPSSCRAKLQRQDDLKVDV